MKKVDIIFLTLLGFILISILFLAYIVDKEIGKRISKNLEDFHEEEQIREVLISFKLPKYKVEIYPKIIWYASKRFNVDWREGVSLALMESYLDPYAVGDSLKGFTNLRALGIMQTLPSTAKEISGTLGLPYKYGITEHNPVFGLIGGIYYFSGRKLAWGSLEHSVKAYIMGDSKLRRYYEGNKRMKKLYKKAKVDQSWERFSRFYSKITKRY